MRNSFSFLGTACRWSLASVLALCVAIVPSRPADAAGIGELICPKLDPMTTFVGKVCWRAMFPIRLAGRIPLSPNGEMGAPEGASTQMVCSCTSGNSTMPLFGITLGFWQPSRLIEVVRAPYCFASVNGLNLESSIGSTFGARPMGGTQPQGTRGKAKEVGFYNWHTYYFPLLGIMKMFDSAQCNPDGITTFGFGQFSFTYPNWYDAMFQAFVQPEVLLFANPVGYAGAAVDCAYTAATGKPLDATYWSAGCWGLNQPWIGHISPNPGMVQATSAIAAKAMALTARLGISKRTLGDDAICASQPMPLIRKSMFKLQMLFPVSETSLSPSTPGAPPSITDPPQQVPLGDASGGQVGQANPTALESVFTGRCTHAIGAPTMRWGAWRHIPATGEDAVYLEWKWTDCCIGYTAN